MRSRSLIPQVLVKYDSPEVQQYAPFRPSKPGDSGCDLANASGGTLMVAPHKSVEVPAGISVKVPEGYVGLVRPRSSTFARRGLLVVEGIIDSGYTGPLFTHVWNPALNGEDKPVLIEPWERLGQLIVVPCISMVLGAVLVVDVLPKTKRGTTGFGSTGA